MANCKSCGAKIFWAKTPNGNSIPLQECGPHKGGNITLVDGVAHILMKITKVEGDTAYAEPSDGNYISHFATCPDAQKWRKGSASRS